MQPAALLMVIFLLVGVSLPQLPVLGLPSVAPAVQLEVGTLNTGRRIPKNVPYRIAKPRKPLRYVHSLSPVAHPRPAAKPLPGKPPVWGFYVNWDPASMVSLRLHLKNLTHLLPEWLVLQNAKGDIDDQSDPTVIAIARQANLPNYSMLTNYRGDWRAGDLEHILRNSGLRRDLIENIRSNLAEHKFAGVNIDFEQLSGKIARRS